MKDHTVGIRRSVSYKNLFCFDFRSCRHCRLRLGTPLGDLFQSRVVLLPPIRGQRCCRGRPDSGRAKCRRGRGRPSSETSPRNATNRWTADSPVEDGSSRHTIQTTTHTCQPARCLPSAVWLPLLANQFGLLFNILHIVVYTVGSRIAFPDQFDLLSTVP